MVVPPGAATLFGQCFSCNIHLQLQAGLHRHMQLQAHAGLLLFTFKQKVRAATVYGQTPLSFPPKVSSHSVYSAMHRLAHGTLARPRVDPAQRIERSCVLRRTAPQPPTRPCARGSSPSTKATAMTIPVISAALLIAPGRQAAVHTNTRHSWRLHTPEEVDNRVVSCMACLA